MSIWIALLLGLVQGVTEFLPVSSSGHLSILQAVFAAFGAELPDLHELVLYDVLLHTATLTAVFLAFRKDIIKLIKAFFSFFSEKGRNDEGLRPARRMLLLVLIATLPVLAVAPFSGTVESLKKNLIFIGCALFLTAFLLFIADRIKPAGKNEKTARVSDAAVVGLMQVIAVIPGISRSGSTIFAGMARGFDRRFAVKFSFLMSIPAVLGATLLHVVEAFREDVVFYFVYIPGMLVAALSGYFAINFLRRMASKGKFGAFSVYCAVVGILSILLHFVLPSPTV
jgi:undecaprenyl-diphosphatase